jgi:hypothetical protein
VTVFLEANGLFSPASPAARQAMIENAGTGPRAAERVEAGARRDFMGGKRRNRWEKQFTGEAEVVSRR